MTTIAVNNFKIWYDTVDPNFTEISRKSNLPSHWLSYQTVLSGKYSDSAIKPINKYVERLVPPPTLIGIDGNTVRLRQGNHAEFFILEKNDGEFYHKDRPWQRQYYNTDQSKYATPGDCFPGAYKFYVPWFIDEDISVSIEQAENSPFTIYPDIAEYKKVLPFIENVEPKFVAFHFKRSGDHMVTDKFGKIPRQSPMFDMVFSANDIIVDKVRNFYEKEKSANS